MVAREVPHEQWDAFLGSFSRQHQGQQASVELHQRGQGTLVEVENCRLQQVWTDRSGGHEQISIVLGEAPESEHVTHIVSEPRRMRFQETESGAQEGLEIEGDEGTTVLHFRWPKRPVTRDSAPPESSPGDASGNAGGKVRS